MKQKLPERRQFIRVEVPLELHIERGGETYSVVTKNISPVGVGVDVKEKFDEGDDLKMVLSLPDSDIPVELEGRVVWQKRISLEDNSSYELGIAIVSIRDDSKNFFLKFLCDLLYNSEYKART